MKRLLVVIVWLAFMIGGTLPCLAGQEEQSVEKTIRAALNGAASFADTRDRSGVLRWYAKDYRGIQDGEWEDLSAVEQWLAAYEEELKRGSRVRFVGEASDVVARVSGATAWATYDYVFHASSEGELKGQDMGKCTALLRKEGTGWLIYHEHCSKKRAGARP